MLSRRLLKRVKLISYLSVYYADSGVLAGRLADVTVDGMRLTGSQAIPKGDVFRLRIDLPAELLGHGEIVVEAECRWCMSTDNPAIYDAGFLFVGIPPDTVEVIDELIRRYGR